MPDIRRNHPVVPRRVLTLCHSSESRCHWLCQCLCQCATGCASACVSVPLAPPVLVSVCHWLRQCFPWATRPTTKTLAEPVAHNPATLRNWHFSAIISAQSGTGQLLGQFTEDRRRNKCRLSLRERTPFRGAKGDAATVIDAPVCLRPIHPLHVGSV